MACGSDNSIQISNMTPKVKTGIVQRFKKGWFSNKWKKEHLVLHKDSMLLWYKDIGDIDSDGHVVLKKVCNFLVVGPYTSNLPDRPKLPYGTTDRHLLAVPSNASRKPSSIYWFLFSDDEDLNSWMSAICNVLPPPPQPPLSEKQGPLPENPPPYAPGHARMPPLNPSAPSAQRNPGQQRQGGGAPIGFSGVNNQINNQQRNRQNVGYRGQGQGQGQGHGQGQGNTTVVVNDRGRSTGSDFATGMLLGGAMGYGMGSMMHPSWGYGYGGGWGYHSGWGHYDYAPDVHIDNTTIVNNIEQNENTEINETNINEINEEDFNNDMAQQEQQNQQQYEAEPTTEANNEANYTEEQGYNDQPYDDNEPIEYGTEQQDYDTGYQDTGYDDYQDNGYDDYGGGDDYGDFGGGDDDFGGGDFGFD